MACSYSPVSGCRRRNGDRRAPRRNRSLHSRLHHRFVVGPLTVAGTAAYVALRLKQARGGAELFNAESLARLHESTGGVPREIDRIAGAALRDAARKKRKTIERDSIDRALQADPASAAA